MYGYCHVIIVSNVVWNPPRPYLLSNRRWAQVCIKWVFEREDSHPKPTTTAAAAAAAKAAAKQMRRDGDLSATVIRYTEASAAMCDGPEVSAALASIVGVYREDFSEAPCLQKLLPFTRPKLKDPRLAAARDRLLAAARVPMGDAPLHERILMSLYAPGRASNAAGGARPSNEAAVARVRATVA